MNLELINKVKDMIIAQANKEGRLLSDDFKSEDEFKQFVISFAIRSCQETLGMGIEQAYDTVMGEGSYKRLADDCWEKLQNA